jgi:hypothetical protein
VRDEQTGLREFDFLILQTGVSQSYGSAPFAGTKNLNVIYCNQNEDGIHNSGLLPQLDTPFSPGLPPFHLLAEGSNMLPKRRTFSVSSMESILRTGSKSHTKVSLIGAKRR